jgi:hypothetical protein
LVLLGMRQTHWSVSKLQLGVAPEQGVSDSVKEQVPPLQVPPEYVCRVVESTQYAGGGVQVVSVCV